MTSSKPKQTRKALTLQQKVDILNKIDLQEDRGGLVIDRSTISRDRKILKNPAYQTIRNRKNMLKTFDESDQ